MMRSTGGESTDVGRDFQPPQAASRTARPGFPLGLPAVERRYDSTDGTRRYLLKLADGKTVETVWMPEGERVDHLHFEPGRLPRRLQVLPDGADGPGTQPDRGRNRRPSAARRRRQRARANADRLNIVMMGQGEPLLNLANVLKATRLLMDPEGMAISPRRITLSTSGIIPKIAELGQRAGAAEAGDFAQRLDRRAAPGADADHAQVSLEGFDRGLPRVSAAPLGKADLRIRAAERRERHRRRRAPRGQAAGASERQGEPDRAESRPRDSLSKLPIPSASRRFRRSSGDRCRASSASRAGSTSTPPAAS